MENGIFYMQPYGKVALRLQERLDACGMNRNQLAQRTGTRFEVIDKWCKGQVERLDLDILARICFVLQCRVEDLLVYRPEST